MAAEAGSQKSSDSGKVYDFKDSKTSGVVTVTKTWDDSISNDERSVPDVTISTAKPGKNPLGYTITYHGNGLVFADGTTENQIIVNSSGKIVSGQYKELLASFGWYSNINCTNKIEIDSDGLPVSGVTSDMDLYAKSKTFVLKNGYNFNKLIPSTATSVVFSDEVMPASTALINVDVDGDNGVVAWMDGTTLKVSTQVKGLKVQANPGSIKMFYNKSNLKNIDLTMLDTQNVTDMRSMFKDCSRLTALDLSSLDTSELQWATAMFSGCSSLTSLDLSMLDFKNVSQLSDWSDNSYYYGAIFANCSSLVNLKLPVLTSKITNLNRIFYACNGLTTLDLSPLNTQNVTSMSFMFDGCSKLTSLDLTPLDTQNVTNMRGMFYDCSGLTNLELSSLNTSNVTNMRGMFYDCSGLTKLDLTSLDTSNVTDMSGIFSDCSKLTDLSIGNKFTFVGSDYDLPKGTWYASDGTAYTSDGNSCTIPSNKADTYTRR